MTDTRTDSVPFCSWRPVAVISVVTLLAISSGCNDPTAPQSQPEQPIQTNRIVAANYALQFLTQRIIGDSVVVEFPAGNVSEPKQWTPNVQQIGAMQKSDLIVVNGKGAPYAEWLVQTTLPSRKVCESCDDIPLKKLIPIPDVQIVHSHGPEGEHSHAYMVPYTWLDPKLASIQATTIAKRLQAVYPDKRATIDGNLQLVLQELEKIKIDSSVDGRAPTVVTTSPQAKFLTRAAGINDVHIAWFDRLYDEDADKTLNLMERLIKENHAAAVVYSNQPHPQLLTLCDQLEIDAVRVELLDLKPEAGGFFSALQQNFNVLQNLPRPATR